MNHSNEFAAAAIVLIAVIFGEFASDLFAKNPMIIILIVAAVIALIYRRARMRSRR
jgi:uncharacterized membrane protein SirB2